MITVLMKLQMSFTYVEIVINSDGGTEEDIKCRIQKLDNTLSNVGKSKKE